jgi:hypothetical protein
LKAGDFEKARQIEEKINTHKNEEYEDLVVPTYAYITFEFCEAVDLILNYHYIRKNQEIEEGSF